MLERQQEQSFVSGFFLGQMFMNINIEFGGEGGSRKVITASLVALVCEEAWAAKVTQLLCTLDTRTHTHTHTHAHAWENNQPEERKNSPAANTKVIP